MYQLKIRETLQIFIRIAKCLNSKKKSKSYLVHVAIGWISVRFVCVVFLCGYLNLIIMFFFQWKSTWNITGVNKARGFTSRNYIFI